MILARRQVIGWLRGPQSLTNCQSCLPLNFRRVGILADLPLPIARCYATGRAVSRPKAHTGRPASTRKPKVAAAPKKATKSAAKKSAVTAKKPKTRAKPRTKSTSKSKIKAKPKPKPKKKVRKVLTEKQKAVVAAKKKRSDLKALKELALKPPTDKPSTAWVVFLTENQKGTISKTLGTEYRNLSTERREVRLFKVSCKYFR